VRKVPAPAAPSAANAQTEVLTETLLRKHLTVDNEYESLLQAARAALSHAKPGSSELDILKEGLRRIIRDAEKRKGVVEKPRPDREAQDGDIPRSVKRAVWKRDGGRCQWPTADGQICGATERIEFHHHLDRGKGGLGSLDNIGLLCKRHNLQAAEAIWGKEHMNQFRRARRTDGEETRLRTPEQESPAPKALEERHPPPGGF